MSVLEVKINEKRFPMPSPGADFAVLRSLDFTVREGEFACVIGPSGCGKTTLLHLISGLDDAVDGSVRIAGARAGAEASPDIGYMFQSPRLMPWMSVVDNVRLVANAQARASGRVESLLRDMGLGKFLQAYPNRLSGGMQRRVALARAFVNEPPLLLLDEPFTSLDVPVAERLRSLLLELWKRHRTMVLFVTHDLREALYLGDRLLFMSPCPGTIVHDMVVDVPRPREFEGPALEQLRLNLLEAHPGLLAGLAEDRDEFLSQQAHADYESRQGYAD